MGIIRRWPACLRSIYLMRGNPPAFRFAKNLQSLDHRLTLLYLAMTNHEGYSNPCTRSFSSKAFRSIRCKSLSKCGSRNDGGRRGIPYRRI